MTSLHYLFYSYLVSIIILAVFKYYSYNDVASLFINPTNTTDISYHPTPTPTPTPKKKKNNCPYKSELLLMCYRKKLIGGKRKLNTSVKKTYSTKATSSVKSTSTPDPNLNSEPGKKSILKRLKIGIKKG
jgi:hypothetical protein